MRAAFLLGAGVFLVLGTWSVAHADGLVSSPSPDRYFSPNGDGQEDTGFVSYCLSDPANVTVTIEGAGSAVIRTLESGSSHQAGCSFGNTFTWDGRNDAGSIVANGVYAFRVHADAGGTIGEVTGQLGVDTRIPGRISSPAPSDTLSATEPVVFAPTTGFAGISQVCSPDNTCATSPQGDGTFQTTFDTTTVLDGPYGLTESVAFSDPFGQPHSYTTEAVPVTISNPPRITLVRADGSSGPDRAFSPNDDGQEDTIQVVYCLSEDADITITIRDAGVVVRTVESSVAHTAGYGGGFGCPNVAFDPANAFTWDGRNNADAPVSDGTYTYRIHAVDSDNSGVDFDGQLAVDSRVPGDVTQPIADATLSDTAQIVFTPTAGFTGITSVCSPDSHCAFDPGPTGTYHTSLDTTALVDGPYDLTESISFNDIFGQSHTYATVAVPVTISNPPRIERISIEGNLTNDRSFSPNGDAQEDTVDVNYCLSEDADLTITIRDQNGVVRTIQDAVPHTAGWSNFFCSGLPFNADNTFTWDGRDDADALVPDGVYTFTIHAVDAGGATVDATGQLEVDTRVPGTITQPSAEATVSGITPVLFTPTAGFGGIQQVCSPTNDCTPSPASDGAYHTTLDTTELVDGPYDLSESVQYFDTFGQFHQYMTASVRITIATAPRVEEITIDGQVRTDRSFSPNSDGQEDAVDIQYCLSEDADLTITINDPGGVVRTIEDGVPHTAGYAGVFCPGLTSNGNNAFTWDGRNDADALVPDGVYTFTIRAVDAGGASSDTTGQLEVQTKIPGTITKPAADDTLSSVEPVEFTSTTGFTGITQVQFCLENLCATSFSPTQTGLWRTTIDTTQVPDGPATLVAQVSFTDRFDQPHVYGADQVPVVVDQTSPSLTLTADPTTGDAPLPTTFTLDASSPTSATLTYTLDFGDGTTAASGSIPPPYASVDVAHTYDTAGVYLAVASVSDGQGNSAHKSVTITVTEPANRPPHPTLDVTPSSGFVPLDVSAAISATDPDDDPVTYSLDFGDGSAAATGSLPVGGPISHTYSSPDTFTVSLTVSDGHAGHDTTVTQDVVVTQNHGPSATLALDRTSGPAPLDVSAAIGGTDQDNDPLTYSLDFGDATAVQTGSLPAGPIAHTYAAGGHFTVSLTVSDGDLSDTRTVDVTVTQNHAPAATLSLDRTSGHTPLDVSATIGGTDQDNDPLTYSLDFGDGSPVQTGSLPAASPIGHTYTGANTFTVMLTVSDGDLSDTKTVDVTVTDNEPPVANDDNLVVVGTHPGTKNVTANDSDPDQDAFTIVANTQGTLGDVVCTTTSCTYTARDNVTQETTDTFGYTIRDVHGADASAVVHVALEPENLANHPPYAVDDRAVAHGTGPQTIAVLANDTDIDGDQLSIVAFDDRGGRVSCGGGSCTYTAPKGFSSPDTFTYTVSDGNGGRSKATVIVRVRANEDPRVEPDDMVVHGTGADTVLVLFNDVDPDGDALTVLRADPNPDPAKGTATCSGTGGLAGCTFTPTGQTGETTFGYQVDDGHDGIATTYVTVTILADGDPKAVRDEVISHGLRPFSIDVLANDDDPEGDSLTIVGNTDSDAGTVVCGASQCRYTPPDNLPFPIEATFTYTVDDGHGGAHSTASVHVTVNEDQAPHARTDYLSAPGTAIGFRASANIRPLLNDFDPDGDRLDVVNFTQPAHGESVCYLDPAEVWRCSYSPEPDSLQPDSFTYTIGDGYGKFDTATIFVKVLPNHGPNASDDFATAHGSADQSLSLLANDTDPDGDELVVSPATQPAPGTGTVTCELTDCTYHPPAGYDGPYPLQAAINYTVSDGRGGQDTATAHITLIGNQGPIALDDRATARFKAPSSTAVLANDTDPEGDDLIISGFTQPTVGVSECRLTPGGWFCSYTAPAGFLGRDSFTYTIDDQHGGQATATVLVTVVRNHAPVAGDDDVSLIERRLVSIDIPNGNDSDPDGDTLRLYDYTDATNGTVNCDPEKGECTYFADAGSTGPDAFTYVVTDDIGGFSAPATVSISVRPRTPPTAVDDSLTVIEHKSASIDVIANDTNPDGVPLKVVSWTAAQHGIVSCVKPPTPYHVCTYTLDPSYTGPFPLDDSFTYTMTDGRTGESTATVDLTVNANSDPVAQDDQATTHGGKPITISPLLNDSDPDRDPLAIVSISIDGLEGTVTCTDAECHYLPPETPSTPYPFTESFGYTIGDGHGGTASALVEVTDTGGNRAPVAGDDSGSIRTGRELVIDVLANDVDPDSDVLTIVDVSVPTHGVAACPGHHENQENVCTYTPDPDFVGSDAFTYTISDPDGLTATATVTVEVGVNTPVDAQDDDVNVPRTRPTLISVTGNDIDPDGDQLRILSFDPTFPTLTSLGGRVSCNASACWYVPSKTLPGPFPMTDTFTYTVSDGFGVPDSATVTVHVQDNRPPTAVGDTATIHGADTINILGNDSDPDGDELVGLVVDTAGTLGTVDCHEQDLPLNGSCDYTPPAGFDGTDSFAYDVSDPYGASGHATVTIHVIGNHPPVAEDDHEALQDTSPLFINVRHNDRDPDGDPLTVRSAAFRSSGDLGSVVCVAEGCTYTPDAPFSGGDSFEYTVEDGQGGSDSATVFLTFGDSGVAIDLASSQNPAVFGQTVTFTATVTAPGQGTPTGSVSFFDGTTLMGSAELDAGVATLTASGLHVGTHPITADFVGSGPFAGLNGTSPKVDQVIAKGPTQVALVSSQNPARVGSSVTFTATVTPAAPSSGTPTGVVTFKEGITVLGSGSVGPDGKATLSLSDLSVGDHTIVVVYGGDGNFEGSTSSGLVQTILPNQNPIAGTDTLSVAEDSSASQVNVLVNDSDPENDPLTITVVADPPHGTAAIDDHGTASPADDTVTYQPDPDFFGTDTFTYTIHDAQGGTADGTVTVTVTEVNDAVTAAKDAVTTDEDNQVGFDLSTNDSPGPPNESGQGLHYTVTIVPQHGTVVCLDNGTCVYTPAADYHGTDRFTYQVCDDGTTNGAPDPQCATALVDVTINSVIDRYTLTVTLVGAGTSTVTGTGIACPGDCTEVLDEQTVVTLTEQPGNGQVFKSWSSNCTPVTATTCQVAMDAAKTVTATFILAPRTLTVSRTGPGTVTSDPTGINCGTDCSEPYEANTIVHLTAMPATDGLFVSWGGAACVGSTVPTCDVTMDVSKTVTALFRPLFSLTVQKAGTGGGTVTSSPAGVDCGLTCSAKFVQGTSVTLTASPDATSVFGGWSGCDSATGTSCTVSMTANRTVTPTFTQIRISISDDSELEGTALKLVVSISPAPGHAVTVPYSVSPGTAVNPDDYGTASPASPIQIASNGRSVPITIPTMNDLIKESNETLSVVLGAPTGAAILDGTGLGTILTDGDVCTAADTLGTNLLVGTPGDDYLCGLDGNDRLIGLGGNDVLDGGTGADTAEYGTSPNPVTGSLGSTIGGYGTDTLVSIENFVGSGFDDVVSGTDGPNVMSGLDGNDVLRGLGGADALAGGDGADALIGAMGNDTVSGGTGNDTIEAGDGADTVSGDAGGDDMQGGYGADHLNGGDDNDTMWGDSSSSPSGGQGAGNDTLNGNGGDDTMFGQDGKDLMEGASGNDDLFGGTGVDELHGGSLTGGSATHIVQHLDCGTGQDKYSLGPPGESQVNCEKLV